jgi:hypothetical protein
MKVYELKMTCDSSTARSGSRGSSQGEEHDGVSTRRGRAFASSCRPAKTRTVCGWTTFIHVCGRLVGRLGHACLGVARRQPQEYTRDSDRINTQV